jgi:hypothetical protein
MVNPQMGPPRFESEALPGNPPLLSVSIAFRTGSIQVRRPTLSDNANFTDALDHPGNA